MRRLKPQVKKEHYYTNYDSFRRFSSYFTQTELIINLNKKNILEIGPGNGFLSDYLNKRGYKITTCDFDKNLQPDIVADIRNLPIKDGSFDIVCAFEVLEHLPWKEFAVCMKELHRVSKRFILISIPYSSLPLEIIIQAPLIKQIFRKQFFNFYLRIPLFFKKITFDGQHYWEIGRKGFPISKIRKELTKLFKIIEERKPVLNSYHQFFVLEKK